MTPPGDRVGDAAPTPKTKTKTKTKTQRLCICADDFGLYAGVNAAVMALIDVGIVSATGCMVRRSAWSLGASALRDIAASRCDVGLHLDLTAPADGSAGERSLAPLLLQSHARLLPRAPLLQEIKAQLQRFEDTLGRPPAFVDGHRHVHQFPVVRELLLDELVARYGNALPWLRNTVAPPGRRGWPGKAEAIEALGSKGLRRLAQARGFHMNRALLGVYDFSGTSGRYRQRLVDWLVSSADGDVLMCHPALAMDGAAAAADGIGQARLNEFTALCDVRRLLASVETPITLTPLSSVLERETAPATVK